MANEFDAEVEVMARKLNDMHNVTLGEAWPETTLLSWDQLADIHRASLLTQARHVVGLIRQASEDVRRMVKEGGAAFPHVAGCGWNTGMSLLDYFAAAALKGLLAGPNEGTVQNGEGIPYHRWAELAYAYGAAMVAERKRRKLAGRSSEG